MIVKEPKNSIDWKKQKVVIFQSDDWGYCGWSPNNAVYEKLKNTSWKTYIVPESKIIHKGAKSTSSKPSFFLIKAELKSLFYYLKRYRKYNIFVITVLTTSVLLLRGLTIYPV